MISEVVDFNMFFKICVIKYFLDSTFVTPHEIPFSFTKKQQN